MTPNRMALMVGTRSSIMWIVTGLGDLYGLVSSRAGTPAR